MASSTVQTITDNNEFRQPGEPRMIHVSNVITVGAVRSDITLYTIPPGFYALVRTINIFTGYVTNLPFILYDGDTTTYPRILVPTPIGTQFAPGFNFPGVPYTWTLRYAAGDQEAGKMCYVDIDLILVPLPNLQIKS